MLQRIKELWTDEAGLTTVEYTLLLMLIAAACVTTWGQLGSAVDTQVSGVTDTMSGSGSTPAGCQ